MSRPFGMPGIGGSLGQCALCGNNFVMEIILGKKVASFSVRGVEQTLFAHDKCLKEYDGKDATDLPPESPLRQAYEEAKKA